jgi:formate dehydrogenase assembly factor FdhD
MRFHAKLRRVARRNNAVISADPEALMSALQVTKRLVTEGHQSGNQVSIIDALTKAVHMAAAVDTVRTWWSGVRVIVRHTSVDKSSLEILADAIQYQGMTNLYAAKGPSA